MRISPDLSFELPLWSSGLVNVAGLDEAGRGAWAGPVSAAAVVFPPDPCLIARLAGVRDSKQMTPRQRFKWSAAIKSTALAWGIGFASNGEIDSFGILAATRLAMQRALEQLETSPQHLLIDALKLKANPTPQTAIIKGDAKSLSIAAASVLAKTSRDALMCEFDLQFPGYGFARHKGYGTSAHQIALDKLGACAIHRVSFAPVRIVLEMAKDGKKPTA
jgi:ribonuclease HII